MNKKCFSLKKKISIFVWTETVIFIITGVLFFTNMLSDNIVISIAIFIIICSFLAIYFFKCPKCHLPVLEGAGRGFLNQLDVKFCPHCGQDIRKCNIEPDKITNQRLKKH